MVIVNREIIPSVVPVAQVVALIITQISPALYSQTPPATITVVMLIIKVVSVIVVVSLIFLMNTHLVDPVTTAAFSPICKK